MHLTLLLEILMRCRVPYVVYGRRDNLPHYEFCIGGQHVQGRRNTEAKKPLQSRDSAFQRTVVHPMEITETPVFRRLKNDAISDNPFISII
jgi:hypothetical protein